MGDRDISQDLAEQVRDAAGRRQPLRLVGLESKLFYGRSVRGEPLQLGGHRGITSYEPTELVLSARAGTPIPDIEAALSANGQMLAFEPPGFIPTPRRSAVRSPAVWAAHGGPGVAHRVT